MAMTKTEKAAMDALRREVSVARALRWTDEVKRDLMPPKQGGTVTQGWDFNAYNKEVYESWSSCIYHGTGKYIERGQRSATQNPLPLYSTEELALRALRNTLERKCAEALADIDARVEELRGEK